MSEKTQRSGTSLKSSAALINHYKPVGIPAISAAALCQSVKTGRK